MLPTKVAVSSVRRKVSDVDKYELAAYLVNLHTLMDAQSKVVDTASNTSEDIQLVLPNVSVDTILRDLKDLIAKGVIEKFGVTKGVRYKLSS